jgi:hypothetical protein
VVDVHVVVGAIDHGDHGDHCLQPVGGLRLAPEEKPVALFHEEESRSCCLFLAVFLQCTNRDPYRSFSFQVDDYDSYSRV